MRLIVTPALLAYLRLRFPVPADLVSHMGGVHKHSLYRAMSGDTGTLGEKTTADLAKGLGITEEELLRISVGVPSVRDDPFAGKPPELSDLCRAWPSLDESTKSMVLALARAAVLKHSSAARQDDAKTA